MDKCPFCGSAAMMVECGKVCGTIFFYGVCRQCDARGPSAEIASQLPNEAGRAVEIAFKRARELWRKRSG